jgi:hypothetical protein
VLSALDSVGGAAALSTGDTTGRLDVPTAWSLV